MLYRFLVLKLLFFGQSSFATIKSVKFNYSPFTEKCIVLSEKVRGIFFEATSPSKSLLQLSDTLKSFPKISADSKERYLKFSKKSTIQSRDLDDFLSIALGDCSLDSKLKLWYKVFLSKNIKDNVSGEIKARFLESISMNPVLKPLDLSVQISLVDKAVKNAFFNINQSAQRELNQIQKEFLSEYRNLNERNTQSISGFIELMNTGRSPIEIFGYRQIKGDREIYRFQKYVSQGLKITEKFSSRLQKWIQKNCSV